MIEIPRAGSISRRRGVAGLIVAIAAIASSAVLSPGVVRGAAAPTAAAAASSPASGPVTVPLIRTSRNNMGFVAKVEGRPIILLIDTGAPLTVIDAGVYKQSVATDAAQHIPEHVTRLRKINGQTASTGWVQNLQAGAMNFGSCPVGITDLHHVSGPYSYGSRGLPMGGILGLDILAKYTAVIDWGRAQVTFNTGKPSAIGQAALSGGWTAIPLTYTNGRHLAAVCTFGAGGPYHILVDTGAGYTLVDKSVFGKQDVTLGRRHAYMLGINDTMAVSAVTPNSWKVGNYEFKNAPIGVCSIKNGALSETTSGPGRTIGFLGSEWLTLRHAIIDVGGMTLYLK